MDYTWDTSDDEGGMAIDLDAKQDDHAYRQEGVAADEQFAEAKNYDPSEPTDDYDPAEPTHDDVDGPGSHNAHRGASEPKEMAHEYDPAEPTLSDEDGDGDGENEENQSQFDSQNEADLAASEPETKGVDDSLSPMKPPAADLCEELNEEKSLDTGDAVNQKDSPMRIQKSVSQSPSLGQGDTDENTQNSLVDEVNSDVPEVTFDDSDFVLEKEPFVAESDAGANTWSHNENNEEEGGLEADNAEEEDSQEMHPSEQERYRRQEEVDSRNEEALVDLFREESDPERMEDEVEQPVKKVKKKAGSKKIKKKGKKIKKGLSKKGQKKVDEDVEDQRFVELRRDRASVESIEEGEVDGEGLSLVRRKSFDERMSLEVYEQAFDIGGGRVEEPREPGEIVEESRKRSTKKKEKREKKRKKNKREVATIEEGNQGDEDSQKFPSFLAGFFVQDEGEEDVDENLVLSRSFENEGEAFQKTGVKNYRKRHSSGAEDSVKSYEPLDQVREESQDSDHRSKNRKHEERRHEGKEARQRETRDSREVRHEHRHGTPRAREREREREKARSERERERAREKERENREREREREIAARERTRRVEIEERRRRHTRSGSRERRRRSPSTDRQRRSRSRERVARHRRQRSKSRERSVDRERERVKRRHREKSNDRESERRTRRQTHSRSKTPQRRSERASSNKENRDDSYRRRRRHARTTEESDVEERENVRRSQRRQRRERARSSSSSSSSDSSTDSNVIVRRGHRRNFQRSQSSDEGASSDVILVEPERIVINLDEEEDPPSRVDITHHNIDDDSTKLVDGESIPPPPELSRNARGSALIQINPEEPENDDFEGDATPTRDEHTDSLIQDRRKAVHESDYDPAHPTEEPEEHENVSSLRTLAEPVPAPILITTSLVSQAPVPLFPNESGPVPPDHPPPEEVRPSPPPVPSLSESSIPPPVQPLMFNNAIRPQMALLSSPYHHQQQQQQPSPQLQQPSPQLQQPSPQHQQPSPQHQPGLLPFPGAPPGQGQRFPPWPLVNGPNPNIMHQNTGPPGFVPGQRGLLPTPDTRPLFQLENRPLSFAAPLMSQPPPPREAIPLLSAPIRPPMSTMAPLAQLTSLLPGLDRSKISQIRDDQQVSSHQQAPPPQQLHPQMFKHPLPMSNNLVSKGPLMSNSASNNMSPAIRVSRSGRGGGGDLAESTEVVDMDMSPGEDDCELELPSPNSSDSERDDRRRRGRKSNRTSNDISKTVSIGDKGVIQPAVYLKALSKVIEKLAPKGHPTEPGPTAPPDKSKSHSKKQHRLDVNDDDVPASAVDLTNKEKFLKKLHLQERVIDEVKLAIKPYYSSKKITKEQYKLILRKAVPKVCHSKSGNINPQKIQQLVEAYVNKISKGSHPSSKKRKGHAPKEATGPKDGPGTAAAAPPALRQNGERVKKVTR